MNELILTDAVRSDMPSPKMSPKYSFIDSMQVIEVMKQNGWELNRINQRRSNKPELKYYQPHTMRFRNEDFGRPTALNDLIPEIVILNSHNGSTAFKMFAGIFRLACLNGLVVAQSTLSGIKEKHKGTDQAKITELIFRSVDNYYNIFDNIYAMKDRIMKPEEQMSFAREAIKIRWNGKIPINPVQAITPRRPIDKSEDLWTIYNVIQENLLKGGLLLNINHEGNRIVTRKITNVIKDIDLNTALFELAGKFLN